MEEVERRVKLGSVLIQHGLIKAATGVGDALTAALQVALGFPVNMSALGIAGSGLVGAMGGYGLAKLQNTDVDPEDAKRQELLAALRRQAMLARSGTPKAQSPAAPPLRTMFAHGVL